MNHGHIWIIATEAGPTKTKQATTDRLFFTFFLTSFCCSLLDPSSTPDKHLLLVNSKPYVTLEKTASYPPQSIPSRSERNLKRSFPMTSWAPIAPLASSYMTTSCTVQEPSLVDLNNLGLACFLRRDLYEAKEHLRKAHDLCLQKLRRNISSATSIQSNQMDEVDGNEDPDTDDEDTVMTIDDSEHDSTGTTCRERHPCNRNILHTSPSLVSEGNGPQYSGDHRPENDLDTPPRRDGPELRIPRATCPGAVYTMYNRALVLSSSANEDPHTLNWTRAVLLYNLALVYHNIGIHQGVSSALGEALMYYESALDSALGCHIPRVSTPGQYESNPSLNCLWRMFHTEKILLAILNNMGNIHAHLCHLENTRACMESMRLVLAGSAAISDMVYNGNHDVGMMSLTYISEVASNPIAMSDDYTFFLLNSLFQGKGLLLAAAA